MIFARRALMVLLVASAAAIVFSPLLAALCYSDLHAVSTTGRVVAPLSRSVAVAATAAFFALLFGFPFALLIDRARPIVRRFCWAIGLLALMVPPYIVAESTIVLLGPAGKISKGVALMCRFGPNSADTLGRARYAVPGLVYSAPAAGAVLGGCFFPIVAIAVAAANRRTDRRIFEVAWMIEGRRGVVQVASRVLIPPAIGAALLVLSLALTESVAPQLLRVGTISEEIYERIQEGDLASAATLSLPLLPIIVCSGAIGAFMLVRARSASLAGLEGEVPRFKSPGAGKLADSAAISWTTIAAIPALAIPIVGLGWLMADAKLPPETAGAHRLLRASGFFDSLRGAWELARDDAVRTTLLAIVVATIAVVFSILLAKPLIGTRRSAALGAFGAGLAIAPPIVGLGLIVLWNRPSGAIVYESIAIVVLAWLARFLPVSVLLTQTALARVPQELEQAAALMGRGTLRSFFSVALPAALPGLIAAWLAVYVLCATEFATTLLIAPPGAPLLAPSVVNLMRRGQDPEIAACQVLLLIVVALPLLALGVIAIARSMWRLRNG